VCVFVCVYVCELSMCVFRVRLCEKERDGERVGEREKAEAQRSIETRLSLWAIGCVRCVVVCVCVCV